MMNQEHASLEQYVNMPELLARVENDRELLAELFALFLKDYPRLRDALHDAVHAGDPRQVERAAHALKGMLANLSIKHGAELAAEVEAAARAGDAAAKSSRPWLPSTGEEKGLLAAVGDSWRVGNHEDLDRGRRCGFAPHARENS